MSHITLVPAYGRDYKSVAEIKAALLTGQDFEACSYDGSGGYTTAQELLSRGITSANVRYKQLRSVCVVDLRKLEPAKPRKPRGKKAAEAKDFLANHVTVVKVG